MHNIATIYRFNTPFLDISNEKQNLISVYNKIKEHIEFDWILFEIKSEKTENYIKNSFIFDASLWKIEIFYLKELNFDWFFPIFKLNIYLNTDFIKDEKLREKTVNFLSWIFECFDWLNEKEFLIDLDNSIFYKSWFGKKIYPKYDFSNIYQIQEYFESKNWIMLLEGFISKFSWKTFILTTESSNEYYKLHWILLYFIYLIFLMHKNITKTNLVLESLESINTWIYEWNLELAEKRLHYVNNINLETFNNYKSRLELFFKLFK